MKVTITYTKTVSDGNNECQQTRIYSCEPQSETITKPKRIQLSRKKGWRLPENTVVVSRPSKWGNQYRIGDDVPGLKGAKMDREDVVHWHRISMITAPQETIDKIKSELRGKNLACWCRLDCACHADTLLEIAND